jgi:hypothetical protein
MARTYDRPPGVKVTEVASTSVDPLIATPDLLCLVGPASGTIQKQELVGPLTYVTVTGVSSTAGSSTITVTGGASNLSVGMLVENATTPANTTSPFAPNTTITNVSGSTVTLSQNALATISNATITCGVPVKFNNIGTTDVLTLSSVTAVADPDSTQAPTGYSSASGYYNNIGTSTYGVANLQFGSYYFNPTNHTIAPRAVIAKAALKADVTSSSTTITAIGDPDQFCSSGTIIINDSTNGSEQISYTGITTPADEYQTITLLNATGGTFTLSFNGVTIATPLNSTASSSDVQSALAGLSTIGGTGNVSVSGSNGGPYRVEFKGNFAGTNVPSIVANGAALTGTSPTITVAVATSGDNSEFDFTGCTRGINSTNAVGHSADTGTNTSIQQGLAVPSGRSVFVTYNYTPANYYQPYLIDGATTSDIESRFGQAVSSTDGVTVISPLSLAAKIAIENGANRFILQPLFYSPDTDDVMANRQAPTNAQSVLADTWAKVFKGLRSQRNIGVIVPILGQTASYTYGSDGTTTPADLTSTADALQINVAKKLQEHIAFVDQNNQQYTIGIFGEDSTQATTAHNYADRVTVLFNHIKQLQTYVSNNTSYNERMVFIAQTKFSKPSLTGGTTPMYLGGQYAAAAIGGMLVSRSVATPLTRKALGSFSTVEDLRTDKNKTEDSGLGFLVIEQKRDGTIQVRHSLTTDVTSVAKSELSVVRAKYFMLNSLVNTIDTQIIGKMVADDAAPITIQTTISNALRTLQEDGNIVGFSGVQATPKSTDPTIIEVRFNYRPAFPINYINIAFTVDLTTGATSVTTADQANLGA